MSSYPNAPYRFLRQYVYFCTSKASKLSILCPEYEAARMPGHALFRRQYLYFSTSKASKAALSLLVCRARGPRAPVFVLFVLVKQVNCVPAATKAWKCSK